MNAVLTAIILGAGFLFASGQAPTSEIIVVPARADAHRLRTGRFIYRDSNRRKQLGTSRIIIEKSAIAGDYAFSAETIGYLDQQWESIATSSFAPVSAKLSLGKAAVSSPQFDLTYTLGRVTGFVVSRTPPELGAKRPVDAFLSADTVDQRIDWATVLGSDLHAGRQFGFSVYDPNIGTSRVYAQVGALEQIHVPAGSYKVFRIAYRVEKATGAEHYTVFASEHRPRVLVREDFPDGTVSELVEMTNHRDHP